MIEKSTVITRDTTTISQIAAHDSASIIAKVDSIIIEEYNQDDEDVTECVSQIKQGNKISPHQKRNDISKNEIKTPAKKIKVYGVNLSGSWSKTRDSLNKKMTHQQTTNSEIKQKTPIQTNAWDKIIYVLIGITLLLFAGYVVWKNAVQ